MSAEGEMRDGLFSGMPEGGGLSDILQKVMADPEAMAKVRSVMEALRDSSPKEEPNDDGAGADTGVGPIPMPDPGMMEQLSSLVSVLRSMPEGGLFSPRPRSPEKEEQGERGSRRVPMEKRTALLYALKPYLSAERCRAIDYIVGMEKLGEWIRHLK